MKRDGKVIYVHNADVLQKDLILTLSKICYCKEPKLT